MAKRSHRDSGRRLGRRGAARDRAEQARELLEFERSSQQRASIKVVGVGGGGGNALNNMIELGPARRRVHRRQHRRPGAAPQPGRHQAPARHRDHARPRLRRRPRQGPRLGARGARSAARAVQGHRHGLRHRRPGRRHRHRRGADRRRGRARVGRAHGRRRHQALPLRGQGARRATPSAGSTSCTAWSTRVITIPNQRLLALAGKNTAVRDAFKLADDVLFNAVRGISDLITIHGLINLDFADVRTIMNEMGVALMGTGIGARRRPRGRGGARGDLQPAARGPLDRRRPRRADQHHRRPGPDALRGERGLDADPGGGARGREHHLRRGDRREHARGRDARDRDRDRPRRRAHAPRARPRRRRASAAT